MWIILSFFSTFRFLKLIDLVVLIVLKKKNQINYFLEFYVGILKMLNYLLSPHWQYSRRSCDVPDGSRRPVEHTSKVLLYNGNTVQWRHPLCFV